MKTATWATELRGDTTDLQHLATHLTGEIVSVTSGESGYLLRSERLNGIEDVPQAVAEIDRLVAILNGLLKLLRFSRVPLVSARVYGIDAEGSPCTVLLAVPSSIAVRVDDGQTITVYGNS
jgi:hypothetical protein